MEGNKKTSIDLSGFEKWIQVEPDSLSAYFDLSSKHGIVLRSVMAGDKIQLYHRAGQDMSVFADLINS